MKECPSCKKPIEIETECCEYCGLVFSKWEAKNKPLDEKEVEKEIEAARHEFRKEQDKKTFRIIGISVAAVLVAALIWFFVRPALPGFERQIAEDFIRAIKHSDLEKVRQLVNLKGMKSIEKFGPLSPETLRFVGEQIPDTFQITSVEVSATSPVVNIGGTGTAEGSTGKIFFSYEDLILKVSGQEWDKMEGGFTVLPAYNKDAVLLDSFNEKSDPGLNIPPVAENVLRQTDRANKKLVRTFYKKDGRLKALKTIKSVNDAKIVFSADGKYFLAASVLDNKVKIWKTFDWTPVKELDQEYRAESVAAAPDGTAFILGDTYEHCTIFPLTEKGPVNSFRLTVPLGGALNVGMSGNSKIIATGSKQKVLSLWEYPDKTKISRTDLPFEVTGLDFSRTAPYLAVATGKNMFAVWDLRTGKGVTYTIPGISSGIPATALALSPNGRYVLTGFKDGNIAVTDMENFKNRQLIETGSPVMAVSFSADGKVFSTAKDDGKVYLFDLETGRKLDTLKGHTGSVNSVVFSPAGNYLVSAGEDNQIIIWGY